MNRTAAFESAADAIPNGDIDVLAQLLGANPQLARERSSLVHGATLLHYTGANGVEDYRRKTPPNIVEMASLLLDAGAEIDAVADIYGGSTTLSLVASSVHPQRAGVQIALMEMLLDRGAAIDGVPRSANPILGALRNGRSEAARYLAGRGATLDPESAAGVGALDAVRAFEDSNQGSAEQRSAGLAWASEYGHEDVVRFLLDRGMDPSGPHLGQSALHWAAIGGQADVARLLLTRGASLSVRNQYGATALGQAQWSAAQSSSPEEYAAVLTVLDSFAESK